MRLPKTILLGCAATAAVALPAAASASTISYEGDTLVVRAAPGEANFVTLSVEDGKLAVGDSGAATMTFPAGRCERLSEEYPAHCDMPERARLELADGDDRSFTMYDVKIPVAVQGGDGADQLKAGEAGGATLDGGSGDDKLESQDGGDTLVGGPGSDELVGSGGSDTLDGGEGDDVLKPDANSAKPGDDVVDGGAGTDVVDDWVDNASGRPQRPVNVTLDDQANDGRTGEHDNVRNVEVVKAFVAGSYTMGDSADRVELYAPVDQGPSSIEGRGGDDVLIAGEGTQTIDGGAGNDRIEGGFGNDTLTGGPGKDVINGDFTGSQCGVLQSCTVPYGNDVINARDGEADTIDCGVGEDRAVVDAIDTVANCETVERDGAATATTAAGATAAAKVRLSAKRTALRKALNRGLKVSLAGLAAGRVEVRALYAGKVVGQGRAKAAKTGKATVTVRFTKAARRTLARKRTVKLALKTGATRTVVTLAR